MPDDSTRPLPRMCRESRRLVLANRPGPAKSGFGKALAQSHASIFFISTSCPPLFPPPFFVAIPLHTVIPQFDQFGKCVSADARQLSKSLDGARSCVTTRSTHRVRGANQAQPQTRASIMPGTRVWWLSDGFPASCASRARHGVLFSTCDMLGHGRSSAVGWTIKSKDRHDCS